MPCEVTTIIDANLPEVLHFLFMTSNFTPTNQTKWAILRKPNMSTILIKHIMRQWIPGCFSGPCK